jgi:hypothetical protein
MEAPGFYESDYLEGKVYILNEETKLPVGPNVNLERLKKMKVIWTGPQETRRKIRIQNDFTMAAWLISRMEMFPESNFMSFASILGWITVVMNRANLPGGYKINPAHLIGPSSSGKYKKS